MAGKPRERKTIDALELLGVDYAFDDLKEGIPIGRMCAKRKWTIGAFVAWALQDDEHQQKYAEALRIGAEALAHQALEIADNTRYDDEGNAVIGEDGNPEKDERSVARDRLRITTNLDVAGAWSPRYRKKIEAKEEGPNKLALDEALITIADAIMKRRTLAPVEKHIEGSAVRIPDE